MPDTGPSADEDALRWQIAARAYGIWEQEGGPHGRALEHWLRAEAEVTAAPDNPPTFAESEAVDKQEARGSADRRRNLGP